MVHRHKKSGSLHYASFFDLSRGQVFQTFRIMLQDAIYRPGSKENVLHFPVSSVPPAFSAIPPPSLPVLSLSLISDPFFMHYSITLNSHLQCITSSRLSQTHFAVLSPFFSHFAFALLHCIMTLFTTSTFHSFINSLSLFWSRLPPLSVSSPHVFFPIYFDILCISHCLSVPSSF